MKASALTEPVCAVVHLAHQHPYVVHQVTLDPAKIAKHNGAVNLIRLGDYPGDEAHGWQHLDAIEILHVLGKATYDEENKTITVSPLRDDGTGEKYKSPW